MVKSLLHILTFVLLSFVGTTVNAATLEASVDRKELMIDEHLTLTLALINSDTRLRAQGVNPNIDLTLLTEQFELGIPQVNSRYNIFRNRNRSSSEITVTLFPKQAGELTIPAFTVDGESSTPITVTVHRLTGEAAPEFFTRSGVVKNRLWQREQTIAYLDLYHRVELKSAKLGGAIDSEPKLQIQLSKLPQTHRTELHNGIKYNVMRSAWAVAPAIDQTIELYLPDIWIETTDGKQKRFPFSDIVIESRPLPADVPPGTLVGRPTLTQSLSEVKAEQHHTVQLEITLEAPTNVGNLSPEAPDLPFPEGLKVYSESDLRKLAEGENHGSTTVTYRYHIMPLEAGDFQLPGMRLPYFDPERGVMDEVALNPLQLAVTRAPLPANESAPPPGTETRETGFTVKSENTTLPWQIATTLLAILWLTTLFLWRYKKQPTETTEQPSSSITPVDATRHPLQQQLLDAFGSRTLEQGLNAWEAQYGFDDEMRRVVQQVQQQCYGLQEGAEIEALQREVAQIVERINNTPNNSHKNNNIWSPDSFTASHRE